MAENFLKSVWVMQNWKVGSIIAVLLVAISAKRVSNLDVTVLFHIINKYLFSQETETCSLTCVEWFHLSLFKMHIQPCNFQKRKFIVFLFMISGFKEKWFKLKSNLLFYFRINEIGKIDQRQVWAFTGGRVLLPS